MEPPSIAVQQLRKCPSLLVVGIVRTCTSNFIVTVKMFNDSLSIHADRTSSTSHAGSSTGNWVSSRDACNNSPTPTPSFKVLKSRKENTGGITIGSTTSQRSPEVRPVAQHGHWIILKSEAVAAVKSRPSRRRKNLRQWRPKGRGANREHLVTTWVTSEFLSAKKKKTHAIMRFLFFFFYLYPLKLLRPVFFPQFSPRKWGKYF